MNRFLLAAIFAFVLLTQTQPAIADSDDYDCTPSSCPSGYRCAANWSPDGPLMRCKPDYAAPAPAPTNPPFTISAMHCTLPYYADEPSFSDAQHAVDQKAAERCYPYQALRESEYQDAAPSAGSCSASHFSAMSTARYHCAR